MTVYSDPYATEGDCLLVCEAATRKRARQRGGPYPIPYSKIVGKQPKDPHVGDSRYLVPPVELDDGRWVMEVTDEIKAIGNGVEEVNGEMVEVPSTGAVRDDIKVLTVADAGESMKAT